MPNNTPRTSAQSHGDVTLTLQDILDARLRLSRVLPRTPLHRYPRLDDIVGAEVFLKHENHHMIGSFKARGAFNALLMAGRSVQGVVASSTGNHAQGVAYAARALGVPALIVMPAVVNESKLDAVRALGADVEFFGETTSEGQQRAREIAASKDLLLIDDFCDPHVMAGAGTVALEILEDEPRVEMLVLPLGGGALASGCGVAAKAINPSIVTVGVNPSACPATFLSWQAGEVIESPCATMADGLAVDKPEKLTVDIIRRVIDHALLVDELEILDAMRLLMRLTNNLVEPSGAAPLAGVLKMIPLEGVTKVALVVSGGNVSPALFDRLLAP